jgi:hypothetical protein
MKTVPDLIMNPGHFQMWAPKKNPSRGAGWRGDSGRLRLRPSSQTRWGVASKPPPPQGLTALSFTRGDSVAAFFPTSHCAAQQFRSSQGTGHR